jgi:2-polyprenyl-3-methyl-5-hydroxy-6-metoxy-1,4-benzoquinol methylase
MTWLDEFLQRWRIAKARPFLSPGARVLDIGSASGALFRQLDHLVPDGVGIDPTLRQNEEGNNFRLIAGYFPQDMPACGPFDAITMLAVLEHFPETDHASLAAGCRRFLRPGGKLIVTVPSTRVDCILAVLKKFRLIHGMSLEEHHGYEVRQTAEIFCPPHFRLVCHRTFQLGLNHLFVFERSAGND